MAGNGNVRPVNATAGVNIFSKGGWVLGKRLKILLPYQRNVGPINTTAPINVADQHTHGCGNGAAKVAGGVSHVGQGDRHVLGIRDPAQIHDILILMRVGAN